MTFFYIVLAFLVGLLVGWFIWGRLRGELDSLRGDLDRTRSERDRLRADADQAAQIVGLRSWRCSLLRGCSRL